jgi:hypothetical protein
MELDAQIAAVDSLMSQIRAQNTENIDGRILAMALELIYKSGLQRNEVPQVKIGHLTLNAANEPIAITPPGATPITIPGELRVSLTRYLAYLQSDPRYPTGSEALLFPGYGEEKQIERHLKKLSLRLSPREIRKVGMKRHYKFWRDQGYGEQASFQATAAQFRLTKRSARQAVEDKIQPPGRSQGSDRNQARQKLLELLNEIDYLASKREATPLTKEFMDFINHTNLYFYTQKKLADAAKQERRKHLVLFFSMLREKLASIPKVVVVSAPAKPSLPLSEILKNWNP